MEERILEIKKDILRMFYHSKTGHMASAFSCVEILCAVFDRMDADDAFILSKGHGAAALYAVLAEKGIIERSQLLTFYDYNSKLLALASNTLPGIRIPTGSLGQGICFATGEALARKLDGRKSRVYCVIGDGEMQEGSVWEAATLSVSKELNNLMVILDNNGLQASDHIDKIVLHENIKQKWNGFGWNVIVADGHNAREMIQIIEETRVEMVDKPTVLIANTVKGHGIFGVEGIWNCHMKNPSREDWIIICNDFGMDYEELSHI